jgi:hypothetical protein
MKEIALLVWNLKFHYCVLINSLLDPSPEPYKSSPSPLMLFLRPILIFSHLCSDLSKGFFSCAEFYVLIST